MLGVLTDLGELLRDGVSLVLLLGGAFFYLVGAIGMNRMPDLFTRMHAASVSETLGVGLILAGLIVQAGLTLITVKLVAILLLLMLTAPIASHALARAALHDGEKPLLVDDEGRLVPTDPVKLFPELEDRLSQHDEAPAQGTATQGGAPSNS